MSTHGQDALAVALSHLGEEETGENEGPIVRWSISPWTHRDPGPWAKWCAAFVSTCVLEVMAVQDFDPEGWHHIGSTSCDRLFARCQKRGWTAEGVEEAQPGDLVFFGVEGNLHHVGFVEKLEGRTLHTVEGNAGNKVRRRSYDLSCPGLYGRARLPA